VKRPRARARARKTQPIGIAGRQGPHAGFTATLGLTSIGARLSFSASLRVASALPRGESELRSQLKTAAMSVPLNIAEGTGKPSPADRAHAHAIARGSAMECGAIVDVCAIAGYISAEDARYGKGLIVRTVAMLSKMCR
jgi:four helix bundle protein